MFDTERFINGLHEYLAKAFGPVNARHAELETRVTALELEVRLGKMLAEGEDGDSHD